MRYSLAIRTTAWTSSVLVGLTTADGEIRGGAGNLEGILEIFQPLGVACDLVFADRGGERRECLFEVELGDAGWERARRRIGGDTHHSSSPLMRCVVRNTCCSSCAIWCRGGEIADPWCSPCTEVCTNCTIAPLRPPVPCALWLHGLTTSDEMNGEGTMAGGRLEGKVVLLTGIGGGMGRVTARLFAREGATVVGCDLDADGAAETVRLVEADGGAIESSAPLGLGTGKTSIAGSAARSNATAASTCSTTTPACRNSRRSPR